MAVRWRLALVLPAAGAMLVAGCRGGGDARDVGAAVRVDTTNENPHDGLSTQEMSQEAQPLTPEEARARGLVDTTTHLENEGGRDLPIPGGGPGAPGAPVPDSSLRGTLPDNTAAPRDTLQGPPVVRPAPPAAPPATTPPARP